jgi:DNA-3-methyladenine glycosylase II
MTAGTFFLMPLPPFRLELTVWTLRRRADNAVDRWDGRDYCRVLALPGGPLEVAVRQIGSPEVPKLEVTTRGRRLSAHRKASVSIDLQRLLGLNVDLAAFYRFAERGDPLRPLAIRFRGMKPPRFASNFEGLINGIACQQLTLTVGIQLLNRLARACGAAFHGADAVTHAFPRARDLVEVSPATLRGLGFSRQKARAMLGLARSVAEGDLDLESLSDLPDEAAIARLQELRGVGRWTAEYVLLRGLGRIHVFPGDDVGARNNLRSWLGLPKPLDYDGVGRTLHRWRKYGGLLYFHLLLDRLADAGAFDIRGTSGDALETHMPAEEAGPPRRRSPGERLRWRARPRKRRTSDPRRA